MTTPSADRLAEESPEAAPLGMSWLTYLVLSALWFPFLVYMLGATCFELGSWVVVALIGAFIAGRWVDAIWPTKNGSEERAGAWARMRTVNAPVEFVLTILTVGFVALDFPRRLTFAWSRPALDRFVTEIHAGKVPFLPPDEFGTSWFDTTRAERPKLGLYSIVRIECRADQTIRFHVSDTAGWTSGLLYAPAAESRGLPYDARDAFDPPWFRFFQMY
jgi:hypothetical protein